jgi:hypothetical protein
LSRNDQAIPSSAPSSGWKAIADLSSLVVGVDATDDGRQGPILDEAVDLETFLPIATSTR